MSKPILPQAGVLLLCLLLFPAPAHAFWVWTPETNKWENPKHAVKNTPQEQLKYAVEFYEAKDDERAMTELKKVIKHYPHSREAAEAQFTIAECFFRRGEMAKAFKNYQLVIDKYPFRERSSDIVKKEYDIAGRLMEGRGKRSKFVDTVVGNDSNVIDIYRTVIKNAPYGEYAAPSQYKIGVFLQDKGLYQEARDEFEKTMNDYPDSEWAKAAQYQIALSDAKRSSKSEYDQKVTQAAIQEFKDFVKDNPSTELSKDAQEQIHQLTQKEAENNFVIAKFYEKQKKYDAAKIYYSSIVENYKNTPLAVKALNKLQELNNIK